MATGISHKFVSAKADGGDNTLVQPGDWNDDHDIDTRLDLSATLLRLPSNASALTTTEAEAGWDSTDKLVRVYDTQRERNISDVGWLPYAYPIVFSPTATFTTALTLSPTEAIGVPIFVPGHMLVDRVRVRNTDTTLERTWEWRLYVQRLNNGNSGEATLDEIAGANGTETFTASAASTRAADATSAPVYIGPGTYWLVIRNSHGSNNFVVGTSAVSTAFTVNSYINGDIASALGSTLDFTTWTAISKRTEMVATRIDGRVFGQTTEF